MNKYWMYVIISGITEIFWVAGLKYTESYWGWLIVIAAISISFVLLLKACAVLPTGTVYAVFAGIGTVGTVLTEMVIFKEPIHLAKIGLIFVLLIGIIGLKSVTSESKQQTKSS
ncbi:multidrug efflux SMR transporter [Paenibacillus sp. SYP-B3998]|uniref:Multidrug efflux SMR transporter n=1 Tax=Paenibacillus sp. SYP-B3998 TaxID=2678564 RepID=A0A6G3ZZE0_9BACL|nr:multidrug efflux SMR transporter [Paenibacillus sp. SYP-B3998]NEW07586.1 multidrug efflux SMR transporter [Paenibacillus sp. SYP-B3998]